MAKKVSNKEAQALVSTRVPFETHQGSIFAETLDGGKAYVVYSYGKHHPMFLWIEGRGWLCNEDRVSATTSKQRGQVHPRDPVTDSTTDEMKALIASF